MPDVLGFSGLFGLKILFSDVLRSPRGNSHVEPRGRGPGVWARRGPATWARRTSERAHAVNK